MATFDLKSRLTSMGFTTQAKLEISAEQRDFINEKRRSESIKALRSFSLVAVVVSFLGTIGAFTIAPKNLEWPCFAISILIGIGSIVTVIMIDHFRVEKWVGLKTHLIIGNVLAILGLCILLQGVMTFPDASRSFIIIVGLIWVTILWYVGTLSVLFGRSIVVMKILLLIPPLGVYHYNDGPGIVPLSIALVLVDVYVMVYYYFFNLRSERHAILELKSRELILQNERLQIQAIESELAVARELQQNLVRPAETTLHGDKQITIFQANATSLGGDWVAARVLPDGRYVVAVGDGTGKGVPAAMVVQTIQALWVAGLNDLGWHPLSWFQSVNRTLRTMGRQHPHTLTLGLLVLDDNEAIYYSAGPMPLFVVGDSRIAESTKAITGDGHLLGIYADPQVKPVRVSLPEYTPFALMLATDGIIPKRALAKEHRMYDLLAQVTQGGKAAVRNIQTEDDKILVLIQRSEALRSAS
ncbi:MAG: hypothetical protein FJ146_18790 [Deltaproteobacteria bacterium]|nr:hypothetical protein [Deltaproteobacteria bacterium]